jgi:hypothetical protein
LPASLIAGLLYDKVNSHIPFYFGAATAIISAILMLFFIRKEKMILRSTKPNILSEK